MDFEVELNECSLEQVLRQEFIFQTKYLSLVILSESEGACDRERVEGPRGFFFHPCCISEFSRYLGCVQSLLEIDFRFERMNMPETQRQKPRAAFQINNFGGTGNFGNWLAARGPSAASHTTATYPNDGVQSRSAAFPTLQVVGGRGNL